jgi:hypothetical protein
MLVLLSFADHSGPAVDRPHQVSIVCLKYLLLAIRAYEDSIILPDGCDKLQWRDAAGIKAEERATYEVCDQ